MPDTYSTIADWWCGQGSLASGSCVSMDQIAKRIALFVPENSYPWKEVEEDFDGCMVNYIQPANGGRDITTDGLLKMLGETMA